MKKKFRVLVRREKHIPFCLYVSNNYGDHHTSINFYRVEDIETTIKVLQKATRRFHLAEKERSDHD